MSVFCAKVVVLMNTNLIKPFTRVLSIEVLSSQYFKIHSIEVQKYSWLPRM